MLDIVIGILEKLTLTFKNEVRVTKQETFDTVVNGLRKQNKRAVGPTGSCMFRTGDGLKCAVGMLIPDSRYTVALDDPSSGKCAFDITTELGHDRFLCSDLQGVHDGSFIEDWEPGFEKVAIKYGLVYTKV